MKLSIKPLVVGLSVAALALAGSASRQALAVGTDPTLTLTSADVLASNSGVVSITVFGTYSFDDLMQFSFPAGLIVFQGSRFIRYDFDGTVAEGNLASLQDGLSVDEVAAVRAASTAPPAPARLTHLSAGQMQVVLQGFDPGSVSLVVYAVLESTPFVSNTLTVAVP